MDRHRTSAASVHLSHARGRNAYASPTLRFPSIPSLATPTIVHTPHALDFGPDYRRLHVVTKEPPEVLAAYTVLVPQSDQDGNDMAGIRMPDVSCALRTFTGWNVPNVRKSTAGATQYLFSQTGSYIPFPWNAKDRQSRQDPRKSVEERFPDKSKYLACVANSARELVRQRLLLPDDTAKLLQTASSHWDWRSNESGSFTLETRTSR